MSLQGARQVVLGFHPQRPVVMEVSAAPLSSDGGLLVVREFDERIGLTARFAAALEDARDPSWTRHGVLSMVRQRIYGVLADYEDQNDHDELRSDPVFKLIADRLPDGPDLASQPTLSRFENAVTIADLWRLRDVLMEQFLDGFAAPPSRITLDIDAFDEPRQTKVLPQQRLGRRAVSGLGPCGLQPLVRRTLPARRKERTGIIALRDTRLSRDSTTPADHASQPLVPGPRDSAAAGGKIRR